MPIKPEHKIYYVGRKNVYACAGCKHKFVTVDLIRATTPFMVRCPNCEEGSAQSSFYRVPQDLLPTVEWYKPCGEEYGALDDDTKEYVDNGALLYRPVPEETLKVLREVGTFKEEIPTVMVATVDLDKPQGGQIKQEHI